MRDIPDLSAHARAATTYPSDGRDLRGYFLTPPGAGPFPALLYNHGSGGLRPAAFDGIATLVGLGYAVFAAIRRGHNDNPGPYWLDRLGAPWGDPAMGPPLVAALRDECDDTLAALAWLRARPEIDAARVGIVGASYGGVMTILAAARSGDFRAGVSFAGPSQSWPDVPALREALIEAAGAARAPLFLIQAANDNSLLPTYALATALFAADKPHEVRIYPPIGADARDGHAIFSTGIPLWRDDVARFLARWLG